MSGIPVSGLKLVLSTVSKSFLIIFALIFITEMVVLGMEEGSIEPVFREIGNRILLVTRQLQIESQRIIDNQGVLYKEITNLSSFFAIAKQIGSLFVSAYTIFLWLKVLTLIMGYTPGSSTDQMFRNIMLALVVFFVFQSMFILGNNAIAKDIDCFAGCPKSVTGALLTPLNAFITFFRAVPYLLTPIKEIII